MLSSAPAHCSITTPSCNTPEAGSYYLFNFSVKMKPNLYLTLTLILTLILTLTAGLGADPSILLNYGKAGLSANPGILIMGKPAWVLTLAHKAEYFGQTLT